MDRLRKVVIQVVATSESGQMYIQNSEYDEETDTVRDLGTELVDRIYSHSGRFDGTINGPLAESEVLAQLLSDVYAQIDNLRTRVAEDGF